MALAAPPWPVTLPASLLAEPQEMSGSGEGVPVDQVRAQLAHPSCLPPVRERVWVEVVRRARRCGEPWPTVALGLAVPMLRRTLARAVSADPVDVAELQQEALLAVAEEVAAGPDVKGGVCWERRLVRAADAARHRIYYRSKAQPQVVPLREYDGELDAGVVLPDVAEGFDGGGVYDAYGVLVRAVRAGAITMAEAQLIARSRLRGAAMTVLSVERKVPLRTLHRRRADAERRLVEFLRPENGPDAVAAPEESDAWHAVPADSSLSG